MKKMAAFCLMAGFALTTVAQVSTLVDTGKDGALIAPGLEFGQGQFGYGAIVGFSIDGIFDVQGDFLYADFDESYGLIQNANSTGFSVSIAWWMLMKELTSDLNFNLGLKAGLENYAYKNFKFWSVDSANFDEFNSYVGGTICADAQLKYNFGGSWFVAPDVTVGLGVIGRNESIDGVEGKGTYTGLVGNASLILGKRSFAGSVFFLKVGQTFNTYDMPSAFRVNVGYVLAL